jgi:alpha-mannosidase
VTIRRSPGVSAIVLTGEYKGKDSGTKKLSWIQEVVLYKGSSRIDFKIDIDWDTAQRRIRVAFPTPIPVSKGTYAIPYGALKRGTYEHNLNIMPSTNGDWPAINWVDVHSDAENWGVGLLNAGMPSHKVIDGVIFMSVLRSPTESWCLNEPEYYDCPDFDGARDAGQHTFTYTLVPHNGDWRDAGMEKLGIEFNTPMIARTIKESGDGSLPAMHSFMQFEATPNVVISAIKKAEKGDFVIVRLAETNGEDGSAGIKLAGAGENAALVNFLERKDQPVSGGKVSLTPFKIQTVKLPKK